MKDQRIILPGGAGLVGQNLVARLKQKGFKDLVVLDKHQANIAIMRGLHPDISIEYADLAEPGEWQHHFKGANAVVTLQAQIGGNSQREFVRNNVNSMKLILQEAQRQKIPYLVHVSSSVVESEACDYYTETKKQQEQLVLDNPIPHVVLRPTLMFGWFDRKHLGWLSRFMKKMPLFPIPGHGNYMRQPLYSMDFCDIIIRSLETRMTGSYNISGLEKMGYIDIIRSIKRNTQSRAIIFSIPYGLFHLLLRIWGMFDRNPPFTFKQLEALVIKEEFEIIDWPGIFHVEPTPFAKAIYETFNHPVYSRVVLEF